MLVRLPSGAGTFPDDGSLGQYMDIDCYACVTGALAGVLCGAHALDQPTLAHVIQANRAVYGIDLPQTASRAVQTARL